MAEESRKKKSIKNIAISFCSNIFIYILSLLTSKMIKENLGLQVMGLNGVLSNVISILGLSELGFDTAITFALYKPLSENNQTLIKSLMHFYKRAYECVALAVLIIGLILLPFIPNFIKGGTFSKSYIYLVYLLFLFNSVVSYLLVYKRTIIAADQKVYIITLFSLVCTYVTKIAQLAALYFTSNYVLYLCIQIVCSITLNVSLSLKCDKLYPYLKGKAEKLPEDVKKLIINKVKALFLHSLGAVVVFGTDNLLISYFCGVTEVGKYTSYMAIIGIISTLITIVFNNMKDSIGNFLVTEDKSRQEVLVNRLVFLNQTIVGICGVCLALLLTPFIRVWFGEDTVLSNDIILAMMISYYISRNRNAISNVKYAAGIFEPDKFVPIIESLINLVSSIIFAKYFGLIGVIIGTILSSLLCPFWTEPFFVYKTLFNKGIWGYLGQYVVNIVRTIGIYLVCDFILNKCIKYQPTNIFNFLLEAAILFIIVCMIWFITIFWKKDTKYFMKLFFSKIKKN